MASWLGLDLHHVLPETLCLPLSTSAYRGPYQVTAVIDSCLLQLKSPPSNSRTKCRVLGRSEVPCCPGGWVSSGPQNIKYKTWLAHQQCEKRPGLCHRQLLDRISIKCCDSKSMQWYPLPTTPRNANSDKAGPSWWYASLVCCSPNDWPSVYASSLLPTIPSVFCTLHFQHEKP